MIAEVIAPFRTIEERDTVYKKMKETQPEESKLKCEVCKGERKKIITLKGLKSCFEVEFTVDEGTTVNYLEPF